MQRLLIIQCIAGIIGGIIAARKGRGILVWSLLCFIFPLLTIVLAVLPSPKQQTAGRRCPSCFRLISPRETACRYCNRETPIELVKCSTCGSYIPEHEKCPVCDQKK